MTKWIYGTTGLLAGVIIGVAAHQPWLALTAALLFLVAAVYIAAWRQAGELEAGLVELPVWLVVTCPRCGREITAPFMPRHIVYTCDGCGQRWRLTADETAEAVGNE